MKYEINSLKTTGIKSLDNVQDTINPRRTSFDLVQIKAS